MEIPIYVSARILRHISRGIYRTPAGALKELISNAYDAGATKITINTGYPAFEKITITDTGKGMDLDEFEKIIGNIGLSSKVAGTVFNLPDSNVARTTIGHYGIGILAIGQLCSKAKITSKNTGSLEGFEATIDFEQFEIEDKDGITRSKIKDEKIIEEADSKAEKDNKLPIGKCKIKHLKYSDKDKDTHFTKVELEQVRDVIHQKLSGAFHETYKTPPPKVPKKYSANFEQLLKLFREYEDDIKRGQYPYEKLCWELAMYSPLKYPSLNVFDSNLAPFKALANSHNFEVVVDGMKIHKPFEKGFFEDKEYPVREFFVWKDEEYYKDKKVSGYLIYRQRIRPKCMQGILVREAGVAIGMYDLTFLEYPYHEATKFEQLTGELFVEGLSGALNIDRNSFNETDDSYLGLVKWFHDKLHNEVFRGIKRDQTAKRENALESFTKLNNQYSKMFKDGYSIAFKDLGKEKTLFHKEGKVLYINKNHPQGKPAKSAIDTLFLASFLVVSDIVSSRKMEEILNNIAEVKNK